MNWNVSQAILIHLTILSELIRLFKYSCESILGTFNKYVKYSFLCLFYCSFLSFFLIKELFQRRSEFYDPLWVDKGSPASFEILFNHEILLLRRTDVVDRITIQTFCYLFGNCCRTWLESRWHLRPITICLELVVRPSYTSYKISDRLQPPWKLQ